MEAIAICTHAATLIVAGRILTGRKPENVGEEDFQGFTCGVWGFSRRGKGEEGEEQWEGKGLAGGWNVVENGECEYLSGGQERGW